MIFTETLNHWGIIYENLGHMAEWPVTITTLSLGQKLEQKKTNQNTDSKENFLASTVGISAEILI